MTPGVLRALQIVQVFGSASLLSFGGGNAVIPQIQLQSVHTYGWLSAAQFAKAFAIAQAAPGPSTLLVSAIGYDAGGLVGAVLATVAMILPAWLMVFLAARFWLGGAQKRWHKAVEDGLGPLAIGLILASAVVIARSTEHGVMPVALTAIATVVLCAFRPNPFWVMAACGTAGWVLRL